MTSLPSTSREITVVYYTSNREVPAFEAGIIRSLRESCGDAPVVSVSQCPVDFGHNICVGEIGVNEMNAIHQALIGVEAASTPYVALTESDSLFPQCMFTLNAILPGHWHYPSVAYMAVEGSNLFWPKKMRELVGVTERENAIRVLRTIFEARPKYVAQAIRKLTKRETFDTSRQPAITIKTTRNMHTRSPHGREPVERIEFWGTASDLWERLR